MDLNKIFWMDADKIIFKAIAFWAIDRGSAEFCSPFKELREKAEPISSLDPWMYWLACIINAMPGYIQSFYLEWKTRWQIADSYLIYL